jgi:hypothetical protein
MDTTRSARTAGDGTGREDAIRGASIIPGRHVWRKRRGLLTWADLARRYRAMRHPRGAYTTPLPEDLLPPWREASHGR